MSTINPYPDDYQVWKDHPDSPEAPRPVPKAVVLTPRERALVDTAFRAGYAQGHWNASKNIRAGIDGEIERWVEASCENGENGEFGELPCV